ncbi:MAG: response regulator [Rhodospirillaceae bacterium]|jgi:DNA-binding response OmpR family regulator|nr:response regulator [Rhodospirillaceae bacterium]MBT5665600.1 response regulator [Rhodospirillaceae bacterium]MBT5809675.1 response regulator [Rhodospirillaceae bacterium]
MTEKRLLIVDDEPDFAEFVGIVGEQLGYETLKISDPKKFKDSYNDFTPDVIVLDMVMPEIDGVELIKWLTTQNATAKVVIISGYNPLYAKMAEVLSAAGGLSDVTTLQKPVRINTLKEALA